MKSNKEKNVYTGKFIKVTEQTIEDQLFERAYINNAITIFPIDNEGRLIIIKEKRVHETPNVRWKPVTGFYEDEYSYDENVL